MTLSKREKNIAIVVGALVALFILDQVVFSPYMDALGKIRTLTDAELETQSENQALSNRTLQLQKPWELMKAQTAADESSAEKQAYDAVDTAAIAAGVTVISLKSERTTAVGPFQVISIHVTGDGTTPSIARFMETFEKAPIPVRVEELTLLPHKEGTDNLGMQMTFSTLAPAKPADSAGKTNVSFSGSEARPWNE